MSYEPNLEDTRPQPAVRDTRETPRAADEMTPGVVYGDAQPERRGCGMSALLLGGFALLGLLIVGLATAAGFTTGQREGSAFATSTQQSVITDQINRIPQDVAARNAALLGVRLQFLSTLTPGIPEVQSFSVTATALAESLRATPTLAPTQPATPSPAPIVEATSATPQALATLPPESAFDTAALLQQAQTAVDSGQWQDAIALLDAINGIDPEFQATTVRNLLLRSLNSYAAQLYNSYAPGNPGRLAQAIVLTDRAEEIGTLGDGLAFERTAAQLYLDARRSVGLDPFAAIRAFERLYTQGGQGRYFAEAQQELFNQYVALGDAQAQIGEHCPAVPYYQSALGYLSSSSVSAKLRTSTDLCAVATPLPLPGTVIAPNNLTPIAPLGVPGA
jgi:hypothetical protein